MDAFSSLCSGTHSHACVYFPCFVHILPQEINKNGGGGVRLTSQLYIRNGIILYLVGINYSVNKSVSRGVSTFLGEFGYSFTLPLLLRCICLDGMFPFVQRHILTWSIIHQVKMCLCSCRKLLHLHLCHVYVSQQSETNKGQNFVSARNCFSSRNSHVKSKLLSRRRMIALTILWK